MGTTWTTSMPTEGRSGTRFSSRSVLQMNPKARLVERAGPSLIAEGSGSSAGNQVLQDRASTHGSAPHEIQDREHNYDQDDDANDSKPSEGSDHVTSLHRHELPGQALVQSHPR
jgi:hypothetical protein